MKAEIKELDEQSMAPDFWDDAANSQKVLQKAKKLKDKLDAFENIETSHDDTLMMIEMAEEENDASLVDEVKKTVESLHEQIDKMRLETLLSGKYDDSNAILTFHAGAGGTEAQDWCEMLIRMYQMWAQKNGYTSEIMDSLPGDEALSLIHI